jgi:hypothetical protein
MRPVKAKYAGFLTTLFSQSVCVIYALFNFYTEYFVFHSSYKWNGTNSNEQLNGDRAVRSKVPGNSLLLTLLCQGECGGGDV